jgi:hypothetical protein
MAKVYSVEIRADFLVLANDEADAKTIASVLTSDVDADLPGSCVSELYAHCIGRQDEGMRRQCVNYEGHADHQRAVYTSQKP